MENPDDFDKSLQVVLVKKLVEEVDNFLSELIKKGCLRECKITIHAIPPKDDLRACVNFLISCDL